MKTTRQNNDCRGFISYVLVLTVSAIMSLLMVYAYRKALESQKVQSQVQLRVDYSEKEEAILRSIIAIAPNRAIRAMQHDSNSNTAVSNPLRWENIFTESLVLANASNSMSADLVSAINIPNIRRANIGDTALTVPSRIFAAIPSDTGFVSTGINRSLGSKYPPPLTTVNLTTTARDAIYPIISDSKLYGALASGAVGLDVAKYPKFNLIKYPQINFGYGKPGENFVAKRNWWAFSVDVGGHDDSVTMLARKKRNFVMSIYEIPSQLAISASSFMSLGQYASGAAWRNVTIDGGIFAGKAQVEGTTAINALSSRRGMTLSTGATVGGKSFNAANPFTPGVREAYQLTEGPFFPVSLASESGKASFIPINRGADYFDRFSHSQESNVLSDTSWNNYSIGALQCAMRLDITGVVSNVNPTPTNLRFGYLQNNGQRASIDVILSTANNANAVSPTLPAGFVYIGAEGSTHNFAEPIDVAYGSSGGFSFRQGLSGSITFNNATFGDPNPGGGQKGGYTRPRFPAEASTVPSGQSCLTVYPERIPAFLASINGAATTERNNSIVVNVDYTSSGLNNPNLKPAIPCTNLDYGLILSECGDLTKFTTGFSLVTNLRLYIGDDFNMVERTPPAGYIPGRKFFPPCSIFSPEKRYGFDVDPYAVSLTGQIGSLASDSVATPVRPLDSKTLSGFAVNPNQITINLRPILHPAEIPPITMMNWLVLLEEIRSEFN